MQKLYEELRKLGVRVDVDEFGYATVDGMRILMSTQERRGKTRYEVGLGGKSFANVKNAAYYLVAEYLPAVKRRNELAALCDQLNAAMPEGVKVSVTMYGDAYFSVRSADELREALKRAAAAL